MVLKPSGKWEMIWKNLESRGTVQNMGNYPEKIGVLKPSGKWEVIWKIRILLKLSGKLGNDLNSDSFDTLKNGK